MPEAVGCRMRLRARHLHLVEAVVDKVIGYGINVLATIVIYNWMLGQDITLSENLLAGVGFFVVAVTRSYLLRRWFNGKIERLYEGRK